MNEPASPRNAPTVLLNVPSTSVKRTPERNFLATWIFDKGKNCGNFFLGGGPTPTAESVKARLWFLPGGVESVRKKRIGSNPTPGRNNFGLR